MASRKIRVIVNGKFLSSGPTAVHKVAEEYLLAFDRMIGDGAPEIAGFDVEMLVPPGPLRSLDLRHIPVRPVGGRGGVYWEQRTLPAHARDAVILNFCNLAPAFHRNSLTLVHDIQAYTNPESNSFRFRLLYKSLTPMILRFNRRIFAISEFSRREIQPHMPAGKSIGLAPNGCDHVLRIVPDETAPARFGLTPGRYCMALANPKPHKNIRVLLSAWQDPRVKDVPLVLFGPGSREQFVAAGIAVPPSVVFTGRLPDEDLVGLIKNAGALAFPSLTEGFGLPPLEAMALGCPVVFAPCGALPEVCGDAAMVADPHQPAEWVQSVLSLIDDPQAAEDWRRRGKARANLFNWRRSAEIVLRSIGA